MTNNSKSDSNFQALENANSNFKIQAEIVKKTLENANNKINVVKSVKDKTEVKPFKETNETFNKQPNNKTSNIKQPNKIMNTKQHNNKQLKNKIESKPYKPYKDNKLLDPSEFSIVEDEENIKKKIYVSKKGFIGENRRKPIKTYEDEYEREQDFKINIFKKNRFATPYFQEKKRRNDFYGKKGKPKEESWKKKKKH